MPDPTSVDLIVSGGSIITMDAARRIIRDGALAITGDRIVAVGKRADVQRSHRAARTLDASRSVIVPGFVNSHIHFYHHMHRGMAPDTFDGNQWSNFVHARVAPVLTVEGEIWAAYLVLIELMKSGSTTYLAAGSYNPGPVLEAIPRVGLRGFESRRTFDHVHLGHTSLAESTETCVRENALVMEKYAGGVANNLVRPCVNIVGLGRVSDTLIVKSKELADKYGAKALGMADEIGSLEPGKKADVVLFDADTPEWQPLYCEPYNLVYSASGGSVDTVIVDGKIVMEHREVKTIDEREVIARIRELSRGVEARSGVKPPTRWPIS